MKLSFGYSPCPNDTYMFANIATGKVKLAWTEITPELHDVETLNLMANDGILDISKLSFYAYFKVRRSYQMLMNGGAMGFGCGPVLIGKRQINRKEVYKYRIVFPGEMTTAHLLFRLWEPRAEQRIFTTYDKIFEFISEDKADCGVIIHESRFTFKKLGFQFLVDLGSWWEELTGMPVPLGCIAAKRNLGNSLLNDIDNTLRLSLERANANPSEIFPYISAFAQELTANVLRRHIKYFVNEFSLGFSELGLEAIRMLHKKAHEIGIV